MVQRPFSHPGPGDIWHNESTPITEFRESRNLPGYTQMKTVYYKKDGQKLSTIITSIDTGKSKSTFSKIKPAREDQKTSNEIRTIRNTYANTSLDLKDIRDIKKVMKKTYQVTTAFENKSNTTKINSPKKLPHITGQSAFFPPPSSAVTKDENDIGEMRSRNRSMVLYNTHRTHENNLSHIPIDNSKNNNYIAVGNINNTNLHTSEFENTDDNSRVDYLIEERSAIVNDISSSYRYSIPSNIYKCTKLLEQAADVDAQAMYTEFDIQPSWIPRKHFWNHIFDSRYEALMRNPKWPPLKVILIPRTQVDSIWRKSFESYHNNVVSKILSNVVKKLQFYTNFTFTWNEVSHLSKWWKQTTQKNRLGFRRLLKQGRIEITTGGWVEPDEGTSHIFGLVHQLVEGHQWLKTNLNYVPEVAWLTNSVSHSPTMAYLLAASGIPYMVLTNLHFSWEEWLAEYQYSDFIWLQNWQNDKIGYSYLDEPLNRIGKKRLPKHAVFTHFLQFNSAGFKACGPKQIICTEFNFGNKCNASMDIHPYNINDKAEILLEQYSKSGTLSPHNVIIAPIGGPYRYELQTEFDYQYNNYQKLVEYINANKKIYKATMEFGVPKHYFTNALEKHKLYPTIKGDFLNYAEITSGTPAYWTGYFTSRPLYKILLRRLQSTLRTTEILFSFAINLDAFHATNVTHLFALLVETRESVARLMDRHSVSGTLTKSAMKYAHDLISKTTKNCWYIQEFSASCLSVQRSNTNKTSFLHKYVYRDGEFVSTFRTVIPNDKLYIFNSLTYERVENVELTSRYPNLRVVNHVNKEVIIQVNPVWKYNNQHFIKVSTSFYRIVFTVVIPPMTMELFQIKETYDNSQNAAILYCLHCHSEDVGNTNFYPFKIHPIEEGDIQIENYKLRLTFDEQTGFLKTVIDKETNMEKNVFINYNAFKSSDQNAGMFLFNANKSKPLYDVLKPFKIGLSHKIILIVVGDITTELTVVYGRLLQHTVKIYNLLNNPFSKAIQVESQVDYEYSPKNRELELFLSIQTDITNGNLPEIITDTNGFQYTSRRLNISRRIETNIYPFTSIAYIQDHKHRLNVITDHAQGVTALQEGQLIVVLDRRVLYNDGRGNNEGLSDSSKTYHRHFILLETFIDLEFSKEYGQGNDNELPLPSFASYYLSNSLNYDLDIFIGNRNPSVVYHHNFLSLIKTILPCDVSILNFRTIFNRSPNQKKSPTSALMILHRQSFSCQIANFVHPHCKSDEIFSLENVLYHVRAVYKTLLTGTNKGTILRQLDNNNFPAMEILTLRIHF